MPALRLELVSKISSAGVNDRLSATSSSVAKKPSVHLSGYSYAFFARLRRRTAQLATRATKLFLRPVQGLRKPGLRTPERSKLSPASTLAALLIALTPLPTTPTATAQTSSPAERLQSEVPQPNIYRRGAAVPNMQAVKANMERLFKEILIRDKFDGHADKWYSPHVRDTLINPQNRKMESVDVRGQTIPRDDMWTYCNDPTNIPIQAACPETVQSWLVPFLDVCYWHGEKYGPHRPLESCFSTNTLIYKQFTQDSNWRTCCVPKKYERASSEQIASWFPDGDGWAPMVEIYWPTTALGWENERATSMIVDREKINQCLLASSPLMDNAAPWVAGAIKRIADSAPGGEQVDTSQLLQNITQDIQEVRPQDPSLRFTDSLASQGLTLRVNLAAMDRGYQTRVAQRFCLRPEQFHKLMNPLEDETQRGGGFAVEALDTTIPVWSNYCPQGVELMTDPEKSNLPNVHGTPTDFLAGMRAWYADKLYCQRMHLSNPNFAITRLDRVLGISPRAPLSAQMVGFTCLDGDKLNGGMVPVSLYRHAPVERRTAIADHAVGFMIAAALAPGMGQVNKWYYKPFEPQPYSQLKDMFKGVRQAGTGTNELIRTNPAFSQCTPLSGENYQTSNKADKLYISNVTHAPFTQEQIDERGAPGRKSIDRYVHKWADQQPETISSRDLDEKANNYAAAFRMVKMCPAGFTRWRPPPDEHNSDLIKNLAWVCGEEYFGAGPLPPPR